MLPSCRSLSICLMRMILLILKLLIMSMRRKISPRLMLFLVVIMCLIFLSVLIVRSLLWVVLLRLQMRILRPRVKLCPIMTIRGPIIISVAPRRSMTVRMIRIIMAWVRRVLVVGVLRVPVSMRISLVLLLLIGIGLLTLRARLTRLLIPSSVILIISRLLLLKMVRVIRIFIRMAPRMISCVLIILSSIRVGRLRLRRRALMRVVILHGVRRTSLFGLTVIISAMVLLMPIPKFRSVCLR